MPQSASLSEPRRLGRLRAAAATAGLALALALPSPAWAAPGDLDTSFGTGGTVSTQFSEVDGANGVAVQPDGKIVAVGRKSDRNPVVPRVDFALARYLPDGSLDSGFGTGGKVTTNFGESSSDPDFGDDSGDAAAAVALQPDGRIVVVGVSEGKFALARYLPDGSLDSGFGTGGKVTTDLAGGAASVALQPDGRIVVAGTSNGNFALARYSPDGSPDAGFGAGGQVTTDLGAEDHGLRVVVCPDTIVVGGLTGPSTGPRDFALVAYHLNGSPDTGFGTDGKAIADVDITRGGFGMAAQSDGGIVASGGETMVRYRPDGSTDPDFGSGGKVALAVETTTALVQPDGRIVVAGEKAAGFRNSDFAAARYEANGAPDTGFGADGLVTTAVGGIDRIHDLALQPDGRIVAAGRTGEANPSGDGRFALVRYEG